MSMLFTLLSARKGPACILVTALAAAGCGAGLSSRSELARFQQIGPIPPRADPIAGIPTRPSLAPYKVGTDDVLKVTLSKVVGRDTWRENAQRTFLCRVDSKGEIILPIVGTMTVAGKTVVEIGADITSAYHPRYVIRRPNVHVGIEEYHTCAVSVTGAVAAPGIYYLRRDEMNLLSALLKAGGVVSGEAGAIHIRRIEASGKPEKLTLPVKLPDASDSDIGLRPGDTIEVERLQPQYFMVVGLVNKPGAIPYETGKKYNLAQAIAFAGGIRETHSPPYARIYRSTKDGKLMTAKVTIKGSNATEAGSLLIKPGDIVAVDHTFGTKMRAFLAKLIRGGVFVGANYNLAQ